MTTPEERLQLYFDGELSPEEAQAFSEHLLLSPEDQAELAGMENLRAAMRSTADIWSEDLDMDALYSQIEKNIAADDKRSKFRVIEGEQKRRPSGMWVVGVAAAAAALIGIFAWPTQGPVENPVDSPGVAMTRGTEVEEVDFGENTGTVFAVEGSVGQPLAVVWISDEEVGL